MHWFRMTLVLLVCSFPALAQEIPANEAAKHVGENATVCGTIASEHTATSSKGTPTITILETSPWISRAKGR